ncbi:PA2169 family four-helix-bundle protein [Zobellia amurskyensis]|uniref:PA2169 family four-helix-bundle protein n=1 Tax=Zobellia amurskyensis TaxID=248905 RepID=A0A7X2ZVE2_9FLAO|nr:PA2169 family four-helix-bundle protein [Zobellia amurskyensis]MUH37123.1 PA2169 family four-helix-bundle protein [Zobellia amurskyensis]
MNNDIKEIEDSINDIIQKNEDAIKGYEKAAENSEEIGLKSYFQNKSMERRNFLIELKASAPALKTRNDVDGSVSGAVHRAWMDVKTFFSGDNDEAMLEEAIRGDKAAIEEYNEVLGDTHLPLEAAVVIRKQRDWLMNDLKTIKTLEDVR